MIRPARPAAAAATVQPIAVPVGGLAIEEMVTSAATPRAVPSWAAVLIRPVALPVRVVADSGAETGGGYGGDAQPKAGNSYAGNEARDATGSDGKDQVPGGDAAESDGAQSLVGKSGRKGP